MHDIHAEDGPRLNPKVYVIENSFCVTEPQICRRHESRAHVAAQQWAMKNHCPIIDVTPYKPNTPNTSVTAIPPRRRIVTAPVVPPRPTISPTTIDLSPPLLTYNNGIPLPQSSLHRQRPPVRCRAPTRPPPNRTHRRRPTRRSHSQRT